MTNLEWMLDRIRAQTKSIRMQIDGLPKEVHDSIRKECIDILKQEPEERPSLDKDGCLYWDHILKNTEVTDHEY